MKERTRRIQNEEDAIRFAVSWRDAPSTPRLGSLVTEVVGAGWLEFGGSTKCCCGDAVGVVVNCSWSQFGYSGGVMDRRAVLELRDFLTKCLDGTLDPLPEAVNG